MTKTIEEAAREFMQTAPIEAISPYYEEDMVEMFKGGLEYALSQPLASRLTAQEKFMIRRLHREFKMLYTENRHSIFRWSEGYQGKYELLESIFGKDFFKEGE